MDVEVRDFLVAVEPRVGEQAVAGVAALEAVVSADPDDANVRRENVVLDVFPEIAERNDARRPEVILQRDVDVLRILRADRRIADGDRLVRVADPLLRSADRSS